MFINRYPYTDTHELNLDWIIAKMKELKIEFDEFKVVNQITFSGAWDITKQYPAWTIVSDNNIGYVSIKPVPAGVLLTNGNYWQAVIDYTAQIAGLQMRVVALENTVGDSSSGLVKDVDDLQNDVGTLQNDVNALNILTNRLANRKYLFVSDSYGASVIPKLVSMLEITADDYVSLQVGGSCFGIAETNPLNWLYMIQNATITDKETFTDVVYIGGANELSYNKADVAAHAADCYDYVKTEFPNAIQSYMFCAFIAGIDGDSLTMVDRVRLLRSGMIGVASSRRNFKFCECWYPLADTDNLSDGYLHPNDDGAYYLAQNICSYLNGGTAYYSTNPLDTVSLEDSAHTINSFQMTMYRVNDKAVGIIRAIDVTLASSVALGSGGADITLGKISKRLLRGGCYTSQGELDLVLCTTPVKITAGGDIEVIGKFSLSKSNELKVHLTNTWNASLLTVTAFRCYFAGFEISDYLH